MWHHDFGPFWKFFSHLWTLLCKEMWARGVGNKNTLVSLRGNQHPWKKLWPLSLLLYCKRLEITQIYNVFGGKSSADPLQGRQDVQAGCVHTNPVPWQSDTELGLEELTELPCSSSGLAERPEALPCANTPSLPRWAVVQEVKPLGSGSPCLLVLWSAAPAQHWGSCCAVFFELAAQLSASCPCEFLPPVLVLFALGALVSSHSACLQTKTTSREWSVIEIEMLSYCTGSQRDTAALYTSVWALWDWLHCCLNKTQFWLVYWKALPTLKALFCAQIIKKLAGGCVWSLIHSITLLHMSTYFSLQLQSARSSFRAETCHGLTKSAWNTWRL